MSAFLDEILENSIFISKVENHFHYACEPKDEPYINLAAQARADYIVSRDKDLLDLMTGFDRESKKFRQRFCPLSVIEPQTLLEIMKESERKKDDTE